MALVTNRLYPAQTFQLVGATTSSVYFAQAGTEVTIALQLVGATVAASATLDWSASSTAAIQAGTATWNNAAVTYNSSTVPTGTTTTKVYEDCFIRINSVTGIVTVTVDPSGVSLPMTVNPLNPITGQQAFSLVNGKTIYPGALITAFDTDATWGAPAGTIVVSGGTGASAALDAATKCNGKPALKCFCGTSAGTFVATWTPTNPLRIPNVQALQINFMVSSTNGDNISWSTGFQVWLQTSNSKSIRFQLGPMASSYQPGVWNSVSISRQSTSITTAQLSELDAPGITLTSIKIVNVNTGDTTGFPFWMGEIRADAGVKPGRVCITLDGIYSSQYQQMYPVMKSLGLVGSLAVIGTFLDQTGQLTTAQVTEMYDSGFECIHHTYDGSKNHGYVNATDWPTSASIADDIRSNFALFKSNGWTRGIGHGVWGYAYAFTSSQTEARKQLVRDGLLAGGLVSMRKSLPWNNEITGTKLCSLTRVPQNPLVIEGAIQATSTNTTSDFQACVDAAEARGELAIFTFHRTVTSNPSSLEISIADFTTVMQYIAARRDAGGIIVEPFGKTVSNVWGSSVTSWNPLQQLDA